MPVRYGPCWRRRRECWPWRMSWLGPSSFMSPPERWRPRPPFTTRLRGWASRCQPSWPADPADSFVLVLPAWETRIWDRACEDLEDGFPVHCTGMRYIEQEEEVPTQEEEQGDTQKRPSPRHEVPGGGGEGGTPAKAKLAKPSANGTPTLSTPQPTRRPAANKAMSAFAAHPTPSQQTQASGAAGAAANPKVDAQQVPQTNAGKGGPKGANDRPIGLRKRR